MYQHETALLIISSVAIIMVKAKKNMQAEMTSALDLSVCIIVIIIAKIFLEKISTLTLFLFPVFINLIEL